MRVLPWLITIGGCAAVTAALAGVKYHQIQSAMAMAESYPPNYESVATTLPRDTQWTPIRRLTGSVRAKEYVEIAADSAGRVVELPFAAGEVVKAGDVVLKLFDEDLKARKAALEADIELVNVQLKRTKTLQKQSLASQDQLDTLLSRAQSLKAQVAAIEAQISKLTVRAPFDGRLGIYQQSVGDLMQAGDLLTDITGLSNTLWIDFNVPQGVARVNEGETVRVWSIDGQLIDEATIIAVSNALNPVTRAYSVRAELANPDLRHGELVQIEVAMSKSRTALLLPAKSVRWDSEGPHVFAVKPSEDGAFLPNRARLIRVTVLDEIQGHAVITGDLNAETKIISDGAFKVSDDVLIDIQEATRG